RSLAREFIASLPLLLLLCVAMFGTLLLLGKKVSTVFSGINSGLKVDGPGSAGGWWAPAGAAAPAAPPATMVSHESDRAVGQQAAIKAGQIDDNAQYADYLHYLASYQGTPGLPLDVSERYMISVLDDQQRPLLDAHVRIYADQQQLFDGRTY